MLSKFKTVPRSTDRYSRELGRRLEEALLPATLLKCLSDTGLFLKSEHSTYRIADKEDLIERLLNTKDHKI